jgi:hypothetical protein
MSKPSRREANRTMTAPRFMDNLERLFPQLDRLPHADTLFRLLAEIDIAHIETLTVDLINRFIRNTSCCSTPWPASPGTRHHASPPAACAPGSPSCARPSPPGPWSPSASPPVSRNPPSSAWNSPPLSPATPPATTAAGRPLPAHRPAASSHRPRTKNPRLPPSSPASQPRCSRAHRPAPARVRAWGASCVSAGALWTLLNSIPTLCTNACSASSRRSTWCCWA